MIRIEAAWLEVEPLDMRAGRRAAVVTSLVQSTRRNGHDPYAYLRDVFERLPLTP